MGYRSEVRIATTREGYERICRRVDELSARGDDYPLIGTNVSPDFFDEAGGCVAFGWDYIKWYDGDLDDVSNVSKALAEIEDDGLPVEFCRVGESWDDIQFECHNSNDELSLHVEPVTSIDVFCG